MSRLHVASAALSLTALLVACSSERPPNEKVGTVSQNIQGGTVDKTHSFVVGVSATIQSSMGTEVLTCSGALVTPNMVLTARHCVDDTNPMIDCNTSVFGSRLGQPSQYFVTTNYTITGAPKASKHTVAQILTPTPTAVCGNDIAILILSDMIAPTEAVPAIPNTTHSLTDQSFYNSNGGYTAIGYGQTSPTGTSGTRYMLKDIQMGCIYGDCSIDCAKVPATDLPPGTISENEFIGGDGTCEGDSGSSAWMQDQFDSNTFISMGLLSRGGTSGGQCVGSIWTRVDVWHDFIVQAAQTASSNWTAYPKPTPDWTVYTPPPACPSSGGPAKKDGGAAPAVDSGVGTTPVAGDDGGSSAGNANHATTTTTTSGCAMGPAPDPSKPVPWKTLGAVGLAAVGLVLRRRRRSA